MNLFWKKVWLLIFIIGSHSIHAQISGVIYGIEDGQKSPLPGASIFWEGTETGTYSDENGRYIIEKPSDYHSLVVSFVGFKTQSKDIISRRGVVNFELISSGSELNAVEIVGKVDATTVDLRKADLTYLIDDKELRKAACCNLSESFETNASVDVSFTDAVTGQRQIEMLGLAGKYALIQRENIPYGRGLNANSGLTFIPGPFVEGIQLTKGLSSVVNGYESITGQINVEFHKPESAPKFMANAFLNQGARSEINLIYNDASKADNFTGILAHGSIVPFAQDKNKDGFADMPVRSQINLMPRWHWRSENSNWEGQVGLNYVGDKAEGGQMSFIENGPDTNKSNWGFTSNTSRIEAFGKNGYMFEDNPFRSLGIIYKISNHRKDASFGHRNYEGTENSIYINTIYQDILKTMVHKFRTGISLQADWVNEDLYTGVRESYQYKASQNEVVPGAFVEYTYEPDNRLTLVGGIRADYNTLYQKAFITPRLNFRYSITENTTLRLGGGRGQRTVNVISENLNVLASSRELYFQGADTAMPESAWNAGASISQNLPLGDKTIKFNVDAFYTWFSNKLVTDLNNSREAHFIYTKGSRSFSLLAQADYELFRNFDLRLAYKYLHSQEQYRDGLDASYLVPAHRAFANMAYQIESGWKFDFTANWFGEKALPPTDDSPVQFQQERFSPDFFTFNAQINKTFKKRWEVYLGVENLLNYTQENPIVNSENPFHNYFDSNFTWGPVFGRNIYAGVNFTLE